MSDVRFTSHDLWLSSVGRPRGLRLNPGDGSGSREWGTAAVLATEPSESRTLVGPITAMKWEWQQDALSRDMVIAGFEITTDTCACVATTVNLNTIPD